ncbi:MAG: hypothetical protein KIT84_07880 [Labilithrix sp.]|nr:hypothetical protein [Labilithrix sp.]MCW5810916.1 hypothetical protein [Labilithrix sp.]
MPRLARFLVGLFFALIALGCGRYYEIGSPHGARGQFATWAPPSYNTWSFHSSPAGIVCFDCPVGPEPETVWAPYVGEPGPSLPRSERDVVKEDATLTTFDQVAARRALGEVDLASCGDAGAPRGAGHARVTFDPAGHVTKVVIDAPPGMTKPAVDCVGGHLGATKVPAFRGTPVTVGTSYRVR